MLGNSSCPCLKGTEPLLAVGVSDWRVDSVSALLRESDVERTGSLLVLDEATSALYSQLERVIQNAIERIAGTTTIIAIVHCLSTVINADVFYVLKDRRIVEKGTYR